MKHNATVAYVTTHPVIPREEATITCPCGFKDRTFNFPAAINSMIQKHNKEPHK